MCPAPSDLIKTLTRCSVTSQSTILQTGVSANLKLYSAEQCVYFRELLQAYPTHSVTVTRLTRNGYGTDSQYSDYATIVRLRNSGSVPGKSRIFFSYLSDHIGIGVHSSSYSVDAGRSFPRGKAAGSKS